MTEYSSKSRRSENINLAIQIAVSSIKSIQSASLAVMFSLLGLLTSKIVTFDFSASIIFSIVCLVLSFLSGIWCYHNYIWSLLNHEEMINSFKQRFSFFATYVLFLVGTTTAVIYISSRIA